MPIQLPPREEDQAKAAWFLELQRETNKLETDINTIEDRVNNQSDIIDATLVKTEEPFPNNDTSIATTGAIIDYIDDNSPTDPRVVVDDGGNEASTATVTDNNYAIAIGANAQIAGTNNGGSIAIGGRSSTGSSIQTGSSRSMALGFNATVSSGTNNSIALGQESRVEIDRQLMLGSLNSDNGFTSIRVGNVTYVPSNDLDLTPKNYVDQHIADSEFNDRHYIVINGTNNASASGSLGVSIGDNADVEGTQAVAIGPNASAAGNNSVAVGDTANVDSTALDSIAIGHDADADGIECIAIGHNATVGDGHNTSIALGKDATTTADSELVINNINTITTSDTTELNVGSIRAPAQAYTARAGAVATQAFAPNTTVDIPFSVSVRNVGDITYSSSNNMFTVGTAGVYMIVADVQVSSNADNLQLTIDASLSNYVSETMTGGTIRALSVSRMLYLNAGSTVRIRTRHTSSGSRDLQLHACRFQMYLLG